jgi:DNA-binding CsgD family transcriptional regulator
MSKRGVLRPCLALFSSSVSAIRGLPGHLGLPMAEVEVEERTERSPAVRVRPPPSGTLLATARRAASPGIGRSVLALFEQFIGGPAPAERELPDACERVEQLRLQLDLTARQAEVLGRLAYGRSNKEIAASLDAAEKTVEFHVTQLLRKARVDSRALLIARFWAGAAHR